MKNNFIFLSLLALLFSCVPEDPFLSQEEVARLKTPDRFRLACIRNNEVFIISGNAKNKPTQLTFDGIEKIDVKISFDGTKICYLDYNNNAYVLDTLGGKPKLIESAKPILQMDWVNDETLYLFDGDRIWFYGKSIDIPEFTFPNYLYRDVISACVNSKGQIAYIVADYNERYYSSSTTEYFYIKDLEHENFLSTTDFNNRNLCKVYFDSEGKLYLLRDYESDAQYSFDEYIVYNTSEDAFNAEGFYDIQDRWNQLINLEQRDVLIYVSSNNQSYNLNITDYGKADYTVELTDFSKTKLIVDFK